MKAMILAAGFGTRLRPLSYLQPKPMMPVCNRPMMAYVVEALIRAGVREQVVNLHHLPEPIERHLPETYRGQARFQFSHERDILGTGGGLRKARALLEMEEDFFLVNGDTIQFPPFEKLRDARREHNALAALSLRHPPKGDRFTSVWHQEGLVTGFGRGTGEALMFSGSHCISRRVFRHLPEKEFSGIVDETYQPLLEERQEKIAAVVDDGPWYDVGTPQRYLNAASAVRNMMLEGTVDVPGGSAIVGDSIVHETARVKGKSSQSAVGADCVVDGEVSNCILWKRAKVAEGAQLDCCIVTDDAVIPSGMTVRNSIICREEPLIPRDAGYIFEDGLVIVPFTV